MKLNIRKAKKRDANDIAAIGWYLSDRSAQDIEFIPQLGFSRHCPIDQLIKWFEPFLDVDYFKSVDLYGEYLNLFDAGVFTAHELDEIRRNSFI